MLASARAAEHACIRLSDVQAGLDRLDAEGEVRVTIGALGPGAAWVAAMLVEVDGVAYTDARAAPRPDGTSRCGLSGP